MICENCGEEISSLVLAAADGGQVTCTICGVIQSSYSQVVVEDYSGAYTQTQRIGRIVTEAVKVDEKRDIDAYTSIQMLLENVCKATIKAFDLTNALEIEAKHYWRCFILETSRQSLQVDSIFASSNDSVLDSEKLRAATRQFDNDLDLNIVNARFQRILKYMGDNAYDYCVKLLGKGDALDYATLEEDDDGDGDNDYDDETNDIASKQQNGSKGEKPNTGMPHAIGVPLYLLKKELGHRRLANSPSRSLVIGLKNPYRIIYMLEILYRHDFVWFVVFAYANLPPLVAELRDFLALSKTTRPKSEECYLEKVRTNPLDMSTLERLVATFNIPTEMDQEDVRGPAEAKVLMLNALYNFIMKNFASCTPTSNLYASFLIPRLDLNLVCAILFLAMLACGMGIVANDVVRWIYLQRIPLVACCQMLPASILEATYKTIKLGSRRRKSLLAQQELVSNAFSHANAPHSARFLISTAARLIISTQASPFQFNCWSLVKRLIHIARLPDALVYIADLILNQLVKASDTRSVDGAKRYSTSTFEADCIIYGEGFYGYPWHILGGATVLVACRLAWPIFTLQPPAFPRDTLKRVPVERKPSRRTRNLVHIDIKIEQRQQRVLWFDPGKFTWILKIDTSHEAREEYIKSTCAGNVLNLECEFKQVCHVLNSENAAIYFDGTAILPDVCTSIQDEEESMLLTFDAKHDGYQKCGIRAFLWLMQLAPWHCKEVLQDYINDDILLTRRHVVDSLVQQGDAQLAFECALMPYLDYYKPTTVAKFLKVLTSNFKDEISTRQILSWAASWSGSVLSLLKESINTSDVNKANEPISTRKHVLESIQKILPNNNQIYYTITTCFTNDPLYSGWSIEKALQYENFRRLAPNVRLQIMEMVRAHLNVEWCTRFATTPWTLVANQIESACPIQIKETSGPSATFATGKKVAQESRRLFQELPKHHKVYIPPKTSIGKHHNEMFNEVPPVLYTITLKTIANAIGVGQESLHKCTIDVEQWLASTNKCLATPTRN